MHTFEGTGPYCTRCELPPQNHVHTDPPTLILVTWPNGESTEWWPRLDRETITNHLNNLTESGEESNGTH